MLEENDTVTTIGAGGERVWLYPARVVGRFLRARYLTSWLLMAVLIAAPIGCNCPTLASTCAT